MIGSRSDNESPGDARSHLLGFLEKRQFLFLLLKSESKDIISVIDMVKLLPGRDSGASGYLIRDTLKLPGCLRGK